MTRIEDLCHTHLSHKWLYHLDACAGSVLTPHDYITNVQKRLGNRAWTGFGQCRLCGSFLDPQLEHTEILQHRRRIGTTQISAERKHQCGRDDHGVAQQQVDWKKRMDWTRCRGSSITNANIILDLHAWCRLTSSRPLLSQDAVRPSMRVWLLPMQQQHEVTQRRLRLIANYLTTGMKSRICVTTAFTIVPLFGQRMGRSRHCFQPQRPTSVVDKIALLRQRAAMTRAILPNPSALAEWLLAGIIDRGSASFGVMSLLSTVELEDHDHVDSELTQPCQTTTTSLPSPVKRQRLCSHQASRCARLLPDAVCFLFSDVSA